MTSASSQSRIHSFTRRDSGLVGGEVGKETDSEREPEVDEEEVDPESELEVRERLFMIRRVMLRAACCRARCSISARVGRCLGRTRSETPPYRLVFEISDSYKSSK